MAGFSTNIFLFAFYVQFHGDFSAGGGFQAGVILAAGVILYALIFGTESVRQIIPLSLLRLIIALGLLLFAGVGFLPLFMGANYLDYSVFSTNPQAGQHTGILLVELGVGITVAAVMVTIFLAFAGRGDE